MKRALRISCCLGLLVFSLLVERSERGKAQIGGPNVKKIVPAFGVIVRKEGWEIPKISSDRLSKPSITLDGLPVMTREVKPVNPIVDYEDYYASDSLELRVFLSKRRIISLEEYLFDGRVFANAVRYTPYLDEHSSVGAVIDIYYVDDDGDGSFEKRMDSRNFRLPARLKTLK